MGCAVTNKGSKYLDDIDKKIAKGAAWMVGFKVVDRGCGLISTIVLARLLVPADFGVVAMASLLIGALQLLVSFNFDVHLIQNPKAGKDHFDTAWTFNLMFSILVALVLASIANVASNFYDEPRLEAVIYVLALGYALQGLCNPGPIMFRREMRFDREFRFLLGKRAASLLVTIPLAFLLKSYWALVIGQLFGTILSVALSYTVSDYRPRFSLKAKAELLHSSKWLVVGSIFHFLNGRAAELLIAKFGGAQALGIFTISSEISILPTTELSAPINRAAFPGYARAAADVEQLRSSFLNVISTIALFALPAGIGIASIADLMVPVVLGAKWSAAVPLIQILAIFGVIQAIQTNIGYVYLAQGNIRLVTTITAIQCVVLLSFLIPCVWYWKEIGAAWAFLGSVVTLIPLNQILIAKCLKLSATEFFTRIVRPLVASIVMGCAVLVIKSRLDLAPVLALTVCVVAGALLYACFLYLLWSLVSRPNGPERFCFSKIEDILRKLGVKINLVGY
jgi:lipopolysaccharide exporter